MLNEKGLRESSLQFVQGTLNLRIRTSSLLEVGGPSAGARPPLRPSWGVWLSGWRELSGRLAGAAAVSSVCLVRHPFRSQPARELESHALSTSHTTTLRIVCVLVAEEIPTGDLCLAIDLRRDRPSAPFCFFLVRRRPAIATHPPPKRSTQPPPGFLLGPPLNAPAARAIVELGCRADRI